jgi:DNA-dependent RNA polymerase auxiliary subunit epsilon
MRVTLNRVLREKPEQLYLSLADASHLAKVREFLQEAQYHKHLELGPELDCG